MIRPTPPRQLPKQRPGPSKPLRLASLPSSTSSSSTSLSSSLSSSGTKTGSERLKTLQNDLQIVSRKLCDLKNMSPGTETRELNLPNTIMTNEEFLRLQLIEKIMTKLTEIDREVLSQTGDTKMNRARRNSRDSFGSDLSCLPAHFIIVDRLKDFYSIIKRHEATSSRDKRNSLDEDSCQKTLNGDDLNKESDVINSLKSEIRIQRRELEKYSALVEKHEKTIKSFETAIENSDSAKNKCEVELKSLKCDNSKHLNNMEAIEVKLRDAEKCSEADRALICELKNRISNANVERNTAMETSLRSCAQLAALKSMIARVVKVLKHSPQEESTQISCCETEATLHQDIKTQFDDLLIMIKHLKERRAIAEEKATAQEKEIQEIKKCHERNLSKEKKLCESIMTGLEEQLRAKKNEAINLRQEIKDNKIQLASVIEKNSITTKYEEDTSLIKKLQKQLEEANARIENLVTENNSLASQVDEFRHAFLDADEKCRNTLFLNRVLTEESTRAKEANDDLRKKMADLTQTYLST